VQIFVVSPICVTTPNRLNLLHYITLDASYSRKS